MKRVEVCEDKKVWDNSVLDNDGHPLQLWGWGEVKATHGWRVKRILIYKEDQLIGLTQILLKPLPWPFYSLAYVPRGPVAKEENRTEVLEVVAKYVRRHHKSVVVSVEPNWLEKFTAQGWRPSPNPILMARTLVLDLSSSEEELLAKMAKKTRQYIRKSEKAGVEVSLVKDQADLNACLDIYKQTAERAGFALHEDDYYKDIFDKLGENTQIFMASKEGRVVAFLWLAVSQATAFELYGGVTDEGQQLKANYTLKWEAIRRYKEWGVAEYDFNGLLNDGVSKFKQGFANHETELVGSFDRPLSPFYILWSKGLPFAKKMIRLIKK